MEKENRELRPVSGRRRFLLTSLWMGAVISLRGLFGFRPESAEAAQIVPKTVPKPGMPPAAGTFAKPFTAAVRSIAVEGGTRPFDLVTIKMVIETFGSGTKPIPWAIYVDNAVLKAETRLGASAGTVFEVAVPWRATAGSHTFHGVVDPQNTLGESAADTGNNVSQAVTRVYADWAAWLAGAKAGFKAGLPLWAAGLKFSGIVINGPTASGGRLEQTIDMKVLFRANMLAAGAPGFVVDGFVGAVADAWKSWADSVRVGGLPWYPSFAAVPGPAAPPTPNTPFPLIGLTQNPAPLQPQPLAASIKSRIGIAASWPGGNEGIDDFCRWLHMGFILWTTSAKVMNVMGKGPVPAFAPPHVPAGPVVGGDIVSTPGHIVGAPSWP
ncbi:MAG: hypothetical protein AB1346_13095 [Thermodesulfobacteriota bacterium]